MKVKSFLLVSLGLLCLSSCASLFLTTSYDVGLTSVEAPKDAKQQYGETQVVMLNEDGVSKYSYEDDLIKITWFTTSTSFEFVLRNKSSHSIKIPWDEIAYINPNGESMRCIHSGVKLIDRNNAQAPSIIAKNSSLSDMLVPSDNIYYVSGNYGGWQTKNLFGKYSSQEAANTSVYRGSKVYIVFPIIIENVTNEYTFQFQVKDIIVK